MITTMAYVLMATLLEDWNGLIFILTVLQDFALMHYLTKDKEPK